MVPLIFAEARTVDAQVEYDRDPEMLVWWTTEVECVSALARRERDGRLDGASLAMSLRRLSSLSASWRQIEPGSRIRQTAIRLLRVHPLRAADALQLAAALAVAEDQPQSLPFVTLDARLAQAAEREGFPIVLGSLPPA
jgi:predicted nucleic acid-binding protein